MKNLALLLSICGLLASCTHSVHLVNFSEDFPISKKARARAIEAKSEQFVILGFVQQTDYVNQAYANLQSQCPQGQIAGIATKYYTSHGFFSWTNHIIMDGYCYNN